jgi:glycerol kinase
MMNTGTTRINSTNNLLTTVAYKIGDEVGMGGGCGVGWGTCVRCVWTLVRVG